MEENGKVRITDLHCQNHGLQNFWGHLSKISFSWSCFTIRKLKKKLKLERFSISSILESREKWNYAIFLMSLEQKVLNIGTNILHSFSGISKHIEFQWTRYEILPPSLHYTAHWGFWWWWCVYFWWPQCINPGRFPLQNETK